MTSPGRRRSTTRPGGGGYTRPTRDPARGDRDDKVMTRDDNADVAEGGDARSGAGRVFTPVRPSSDAGHRPAVDTPLELVIRLSAKVLEMGALLTDPWVISAGERGGWLPRLSMARAMRGSGPWNPKATRVMSRILVLVDSTRAFDRPESKAASMAGRCFTMRFCNATKAGMRQRRAQLIHRSSASLPASPLSWNTRRSPSLSR
jgi:hypothetical protein